MQKVKILMQKKNKNIKRVIIPTLAALTAAFQSGAVITADVKQFTDYTADTGYGKLQGHWGESGIQTLLSKGGIKGIR
ncbi:MAG: hypothetical protein J1F64_10535 [Oscillospiraceae bacterium]|nr:hypothetical protein [Oscillospiraceae bacterium]